VATAGALGLSTEVALASAILLQGLQVVPVTLLGLPLVPAALAAKRAGGGGEGGRGRRCPELGPAEPERPPGVYMDP